MPLAAALLLLVFGTISAPAFGAAPQSEPPPSPASAPLTQSQGTPSDSQSPAAKQPSTPSSSQPPKRSAGSKSSTVKRRTHKKKATSPCVASTTASDPANSNSQSTHAESGTPSAQGAAGKTSSKDCPPPKIVVRQGGAKEPSIQLAGGPGTDQAAEKRNTINQLLGATDENLKKTSGMQLSSTQQDTVTQTRQFMEQSKAAMADGDFERARTLAWKAQLLSQDLVNPEK